MPEADLQKAVDEIERAVAECAESVRLASEEEKWGALSDARKAMDALTTYTLPKAVEVLRAGS